MARGDHPQRTSFYGVCLLCGAFLVCWLASSIHILWLSIAIYVVAAIAAVIGFVMTFRDYSI
jgi:Flp pilus assembly protein TadB